MPQRKLDEIVRGQVLLSVPSEATVREAAQQMTARLVGAVLVIDGDQLRGIFTERDLLQRVVAPGLDPDRTPISQVMTCEPVTVEARDQGIEAMRAMNEFNIRHVVVRGRSGGNGYGIVSLRDFVGIDIAVYERELEFQTRVWEGVR